tara:strand:+ start:1620 stop:1742 length:123 start_codon:yes stop_codon:yes gene_type:complete
MKDQYIILALIIVIILLGMKRVEKMKVENDKKLEAINKFS